MVYKLIRRLGILSAKPDGSTREVCIIAWNDGPAKLDIKRISDGDLMRAAKSTTFTRKEAELLRNILNDLDLGEIPE
jgi:hypothetical protein